MGDKVKSKVSFKRLELCIFTFRQASYSSYFTPSSPHRLHIFSLSLTLMYFHPPGIRYVFSSILAHDYGPPRKHSLNRLRISFRHTIPVPSVPKQTRPAFQGPSFTTIHLFITTRQPLLPQLSLCPPCSVKVSFSLRE